MLRLCLLSWMYLVLCAVPAQADYTAADLEAAQRAASQEDITPALQLTSADSAPLIAPATPEITGTATVSLTDLRIPLAQLALATGANDQLQVLRAQRAERPVAISVQGGSLTLPELKKASQALEPPFAIWGPNGAQLPIVIWPDAALVLHTGEALQLSRTHGAFVVNFGFFSAKGARISGSGATNSNVADFRPFLATAATGSAHIRASHISALGFGATAAFSGISFTNGGVFLPPHHTFVAGNIFRDIGALSLRGTAHAAVAHNLFLSASGPAIDLRGGHNARLRGNVITQTHAGPSLRISRGTSDTEITANVLLSNPGAGIEIDGAGMGLNLHDNLIWAQGHAGLSVAFTDCAKIAENHILSNGAKGIVLKTVRDVAVTGNMIARNRTAGLAITQQEIGSDVHIVGNSFVNNRVGLSGASAAQITLLENDFSRQLPRILAGDIAAQSHQLFGDLQGGIPLVLTSGSIAQSRLPNAPCGHNPGAL